jgi:hypothetical protein
LGERERLLQQIVANAMEWALILLPLMIYLLILGLGINRQEHPVAVRGTTNTLGLLLALSGFLLLGPPSWLVHVFLRWGELSYWLAYYVYVALVIALAAWLIYRQRNVLVVYNVQPAVFAHALHEVLNELQVNYSATPGRVALGEGRLVLDIDAVPLLNNVSLRWHGNDDALRGAVEDRLRKALARVEPADATASAILTLLAIALFLFILFAASLFLILG